mgnify:CR=1 FL=1
MTAGKRKRAQGTHTPDKRDEALRLLAEGYTVAAAARAVKTRENTVRDWRDSPDGQRLLAEARAQRAADIANAVARARQLLEDNAVLAAQALVDNLKSSAPSVRTGAARNILDRVGVPVVREIRGTVTQEGVDPSRLTTEELLELDRLNRKVRGEA